MSTFPQVLQDRKCLTIYDISGLLYKVLQGDARDAVQSLCNASQKLLRWYRLTWFDKCINPLYEPVRISPALVCLIRTTYDLRPTDTFL